MSLQRCFISKSSNPYFNLATEEFYLKNISDEIFLVYVNRPSVVVGKHQNVLKEINAPWIYEHNISICRRLSGGGTVYHDSGNLNFSFILNCPHLEKINYARFTFPIIQTLNTLNIKAKNSDRNDLLLEGLKISGNAMHIHKNRVLCHGTLLYNSNLPNLSLALKNIPARYVDKAINSTSSKVTNISNNLTQAISMEDFTNQLFNRTLDFLKDPSLYSPEDSELREIEKLSKEKYSTWDWIYGYSPNYIFKNEMNIDGEIIPFELKVEKGIVKEIFYPDHNENIMFIEALTNVKHDYSSVRTLFIRENLQKLLPEYSPDSFSCNFF